MGYIINVANKIWETALSAVGGHLTVGLGGILFLGFPVAFWCGTYGYAIAAHDGLSLGLSFVIAILTSGVLGAIYAFFYTRMSNDSFAVITLASVIAMQALLTSWDSFTGGTLGIAGVPRPAFVSTLYALCVLEAVVVVLALTVDALLVRTSFGRSLRALRENKQALTALGTSPNTTGGIAIIFACLFTGLSGVFTIMRIQFLDPTLGDMALLVEILTIAIIANTPKTLRLFGITALVILIPEALRFLSFPDTILGYARDMTYSIMLIAIIYYTLNTIATQRTV
jgi:branched-chain amino acid transport system permease protein